MAPNHEETGFLADWRHLGAIPRAGKALVIGGQYPDLRSVFEVTEVAGWDEIPKTLERFQLIVVCTHPEPRSSIASLESVLDTEGVAVLCAPPLNAKGRRLGAMAAQARAARRILRGTRLEAQEVYGALPHPWTPEYVFPLDKAAAAFAIERFVLSRRPTWGWIRSTLRLGTMVSLARSALPGGFILCRLRSDAP